MWRSIRWLGLTAFAGSWFGLLISLPYAPAWGYHTGTAPAWVVFLRPAIDPFQRFAELPEVYRTYAHLLAVSSLGHFAGALMLMQLLRRDGCSRRAERWGVGLALLGTALSAAGAATDARGVPPAFFGVLIACRSWLSGCCSRSGRSKTAGV